MNENAGEQGGDPLIQRQPRLGERFRHLFGIHSWQQSTSAGRTREFCSGCHRERNKVSRFRPPADFPTTNAPPEPETTEKEQEPAPFQPSEETLEFRRKGRKEPEGDLAAAWRWFSGLRMWVKIMGGFILLQVITAIVSIFTG